jgi:hypothetical protein
MPRLILAATFVLVASLAQAEPACSPALARKDPVAFAEHSLAHYQKAVQTGYRLILDKTEVIDGRQRPEEEIDVSFRTQPRSILFHWRKGAGRAERILYVEGENRNAAGRSMMLVQPSGFLIDHLVVTRDPEGADAHAASRQSIVQFGLKTTLERTLAGWKRGLAKGTVTIRYLGTLHPAKLKGQAVIGFESMDSQPDSEGVADYTIYFDSKTCLPAGMVLRDANGKLLGEYYFRDIQLNPEFAKDEFTRSAL